MGLLGGEVVDDLESVEGGTSGDGAGRGREREERRISSRFRGDGSSGRRLTRRLDLREKDEKNSANFQLRRWPRRKRTEVETRLSRTSSEDRS